jgi:hypothetical protein
LFLHQILSASQNRVLYYYNLRMQFSSGQFFSFPEEEAYIIIHFAFDFNKKVSALQRPCLSHLVRLIHDLGGCLNNGALFFRDFQILFGFIISFAYVYK